MKKYFLIPLLAFSSTTFANYYIGLEYGYGDVDQKRSGKFHHHDHIRFDRVSPDGQVGIPGIFVGYRMNDRISWELAYNQYRTDDSRNHFDLTHLIGRSTVDFKAKQLTIRPIYTMPVGNAFSMKAGLGLTYTKYDFRADIHNLEPVDPLLAALDRRRNRRSDKEFGGVASLGIEYNVTNNVAIGATAQYQFDSVAQVPSLKVSALYYF